MRVTHIAYGPAVNESERKAIAHLKAGLETESGDGEWLLLTNPTLLVRDRSYEIDIIVVGPSGVRIIEVKHWGGNWIRENLTKLKGEVSKLKGKRLIVDGMLQRRFRINRVEILFLVTDNSENDDLLRNFQVGGVMFYTLKTWRDALELSKKAGLLLPNQVKDLGDMLKSEIGIPTIDGEMKQFGTYVDLRLLTPEDERFHRIYRGTLSTQRDVSVFLHLYDMSATNLPNPENRAKREWEALHELGQRRRYPWVPDIRDSFQEAPEYAGEMWFFTVIDPVAPSVRERADDDTWDTKARLAFAKEAVTALMELHKAGEGGEPMLHRNLTPETIRVKDDNTPILTDFRFARIPGKVTVTGGGGEDEADAVAPEIRRQGLGAADHRSDVYSLCASLFVLFAERDDDKSREAMKVLAGGTADDPAERATLEKLLGDLSILLDESSPNPAPAQQFTSADEAIAALNTRKSGASFYCTSDTTIEEGAIGLRLGTNVFTNTDVHWQLTTQENHSLLITGLPETGKTTCLLNLCKQMVEAGIQPIIFSDHQDIDERVEKTVGPFRSIDFGAPIFNPLHARMNHRYDELRGLEDCLSAVEVAESNKLTLIRTHAKPQRELAGLFLSRLCHAMYHRGIQNRITHAAIFDEMYEVFIKRINHYLNGDFWEYGISLVFATQGVLVHRAIPNTLALRLDEEDAEFLVQNVPDPQQQRVLIDEIKNLDQFKALYFCAGKNKPYSVGLAGHGVE